MFPTALARFERDYVNKVARHVARHGPYVYLEHIGRRTGTVRRTPLRGFVVGGTMYIGLNHGSTVDWCRNVKVAGRCRVEYRGQWYACDAPEVSAFTAVAQRIPQPERFVMARLLRTERVLTLPLTPTPRDSLRWRHTGRWPRTVSRPT